MPPQISTDNLITQKVPLCNPDMSIGKLQEYLELNSPQFENIDYIYVLDHDILKGVLSIKEVLSSAHDLKVKNIMKTEIITAQKDTTQEEMVYLALSHGLKSIPITSQDKRFMGIVAHDDLLNIFNQEIQKDIFNFGGVFHKVGEEYTSITSSPLHMIRSRLPWLIVGVMGGILAASLIAQFEELLSSFIALASFIPVMVYMSDAAGTQSEALIIRSIALDPNLSFKNYLLREIKVAGVIAIVSGILAGIMAMVTRSNPILGAIIFASMFLSIIASVIIATLSPLVFKKLNFDPAVATGPLATIISDITTLAIYLGVALVLLGQI